ncbi:hypothetical protein EB75_20715 [Mycobacterium sp. ST-F2]|uniref:hypothetical protein n=1 Tax=Mycobacterium sp. ST-F2 TaxID=1490484 RepID=UPI0009403E76|nr:hypothetical protein [Mycobacterium sp. ST-F2]OKH80463.1 hypothetical protein EB75_20715 [Mycobacterium sp. ST-F2]
MTLTDLLPYMIAGCMFILVCVLVVVLCAAVKAFDLEHVNLNANVWKLANFSFTVKGGAQPRRPTTRPPSKSR